MSRRRARQSERGNSLVETALMAPWIFFLMIGVFDFGFYAHAAICTQNAARVAGLVVGSSGTAGVTEACNAAKLEMANLPNASSFGDCSADPLKIAVSNGNVAGQNTRIVTLNYQGIPIFPFPGVTSGTLRFSRTVEVPADYGN